MEKALPDLLDLLAPRDRLAPLAPLDLQALPDPPEHRALRGLLDRPAQPLP